MPKLTKVVVDAAVPRERQFTLWCSELKGFGVFVQPSGTRTYFVDYRNAQNARRRMTIGRHGTVTTEQARKLAMVGPRRHRSGRRPCRGARVTSKIDDCARALREISGRGRKRA